MSSRVPRGCEASPTVRSLSTPVGRVSALIMILYASRQKPALNKGFGAYSGRRVEGEVDAPAAAAAEDARAAARAGSPSPVEAEQGMMEWGVGEVAAAAVAAA